MTRCSRATIVSPFASKRLRTSPMRPRRTASGLIRRSVRCVMASSLTSAGAPCGVAHRAGLLPFDLLPEQVRRRPQAAEHHTEREHDGYDEAEPDCRDLQDKAQVIRPLQPQEPSYDQRRTGEPEPDAQRGPGGHALHADQHRRHEGEHDAPEAEDGRAHHPARRPHSGAPLSSVRASPAVMTEPVTSTPPPPKPTPATPSDSASPIAWSSASSSRGTT